MEEWKPVAGYEAEYEVSDQGRVRSLERAVRNQPSSCRTLPSQIIAPYIRPAGYATVKLAKARKKTSHYVHRLVAQAFIGVGKDGEEVCHRDGDKAHNRLGNLYWGTRFENMADRSRLGESAKGESHGRSKINEAQARAIKDDTRLYRIIAAEYGVSRPLVGMIKNGRIWRHL